MPSLKSHHQELRTKQSGALESCEEDERAPLPAPQSRTVSKTIFKLTKSEKFLPLQHRPQQFREIITRKKVYQSKVKQQLRKLEEAFSLQNQQVQIDEYRPVKQIYELSQLEIGDCKMAGNLSPTSEKYSTCASVNPASWKWETNQTVNCQNQQQLQLTLTKKSKTFFIRGLIENSEFVIKILMVEKLTSSCRTRQFLKLLVRGNRISQQMDQQRSIKVEKVRQLITANYLLKFQLNQKINKLSKKSLQLRKVHANQCQKQAISKLIQNHNNFKIMATKISLVENCRQQYALLHMRSHHRSQRDSQLKTRVLQHLHTINRFKQLCDKLQSHKQSAKLKDYLATVTQTHQIPQQQPINSIQQKLTQVCRDHFIKVSKLQHYLSQNRSKKIIAQLNQNKKCKKLNSYLVFDQSQYSLISYTKQFIYSLQLRQQLKSREQSVRRIYVSHYQQCMIRNMIDDHKINKAVALCVTNKHRVQNQILFSSQSSRYVDNHSRFSRISNKYICRLFIEGLEQHAANRKRLRFTGQILGVMHRKNTLKQVFQAIKSNQSSQSDAESSDVTSQVLATQHIHINSCNSEQIQSLFCEYPQKPQKDQNLQGQKEVIKSSVLEGKRIIDVQEYGSAEFEDEQAISQIQQQQTNQQQLEFAQDSYLGEIQLGSIAKISEIIQKGFMRKFIDGCRYNYTFTAKTQTLNHHRTYRLASSFIGCFFNRRQKSSRQLCQFRLQKQAVRFVDNLKYHNILHKRDNGKIGEIEQMLNWKHRKQIIDVLYVNKRLSVGSAAVAKLRINNHIGKLFLQLQKNEQLKHKQRFIKECRYHRYSKLLLSIDLKSEGIGLAAGLSIKKNIQGRINATIELRARGMAKRAITRIKHSVKQFTCKKTHRSIQVGCEKLESTAHHLQKQALRKGLDQLIAIDQQSQQKHKPVSSHKHQRGYGIQADLQSSVEEAEIMRNRNNGYDLQDKDECESVDKVSDQSRSNYDINQYVLNRYNHTLMQQCFKTLKHNRQYKFSKTKSSIGMHIDAVSSQINCHQLQGKQRHNYLAKCFEGLKMYSKQKIIIRKYLAEFQQISTYSYYPTDQSQLQPFKAIVSAP